MPEDHPQPVTAPLALAAGTGHDIPTPPPGAGHTTGADGLLAALPARLGRYTVVSLLGKGGMGAVYLADDTHLNRRVALKVPHSYGSDAETDRAIRDRFLREARLAASLTHPNLCPIFDCGEINGILYLAMAYLEGKPLAKFIKPGQALAPRAVVTVVRQLALAMHDAHSKGVIHRDLKPANIMVTLTKQPVIMDFGVARRTDGEDTRLTRTGFIVGTPAYMPPEQLNCDQTLIGPATDIYALGVILYELLAGRTPFQGPPGALMAQIMIDPPPSLIKWRGELDPVLDGICGRALAKAPQDRFPTMAAFAVALEEFLKAPARPMPAKPVPSSPPAPAARPQVQPPAPLDEENAATLFNEMAALQVRLAGTPRPQASSRRRPRRLRRRFRLPEWLIPLIGSVAVLAVGGLILGLFFQHLYHRRTSTPSSPSVPPDPDPTPSPKPEPPPSPTPDRVVENLRVAINELREDVKRGRPPNAISKQHVENWLSMSPENRGVLPKEVSSDFARAVILILGDWERGEPLLPLNDLPLWRSALEKDRAGDWHELAASGDAWWGLANAEKRDGWPDKEVRARAYRRYRQALNDPTVWRQERDRMSDRLKNDQ
jgi:serine/threonine protein kinase